MQNFEKARPTFPKRGLFIGIGVMVFLMLVAGVIWFKISAPPKRINISGLALGMALIPDAASSNGKKDSASYDPYYMAETEVTYGQWKKVYDWAVKHGYTFINGGQPGIYASGHENYPVTNISWWDCIAWCNALTEYSNSVAGTRYSCVYQYKGVIARDLGYFGRRAVNADFHSKGFRLPLSMERERVVHYPDLNGSVSEWCFDGFLNRHAPARLNRGMSWFCDKDSILRIVKIGDNPPLHADAHLGFRIARSL